MTIIKENLYKLAITIKQVESLPIKGNKEHMTNSTKIIIIVIVFLITSPLNNLRGLTTSIL